VQSGPTDPLGAAISQAGNDLARAWMRLLSTPPPGSGPPAWLAQLGVDPARMAQLHTTYLEKQARLWTALSTSSAQQPVVEADPGREPFARAGEPDW
jgi:hypothetical protein